MGIMHASNEIESSDDRQGNQAEKAPRRLLVATLRLDDNVVAVAADDVIGAYDVSAYKQQAH